MIELIVLALTLLILWRAWRRANKVEYCLLTGTVTEVYANEKIKFTPVPFEIASCKREDIHLPISEMIFLDNSTGDISVPTDINVIRARAGLDLLDTFNVGTADKSILAMFVVGKLTLYTEDKVEDIILQPAYSYFKCSSWIPADIE